MKKNITRGNDSQCFTTITSHSFSTPPIYTFSFIYFLHSFPMQSIKERYINVPQGLTSAFSLFLSSSFFFSFLTIGARPHVTDSSSGSGGGSSPGIIAASIAAIFGFAALFAVAFVFSKRRRQRLSQAAWTENMLLPSSLIHSSANDDQLEGHDYTRSSPIYHQHPNKQRDSIPAPIPPHNMHFPPPLHPRQGGPLHMSQPSYPPPPPMMGIPGGSGGGHYHSMRGNPYQPFSLPVRRLSQQQQQYDPHLLIEENLNHKEPVQASPPPPQFAPSFSRGPQSLLQAPPLPLGAIEHIRNSSEGRSIWEEEEEEDYERHDEMSLSHHPSVRSIRHHRLERGSVDSTANSLRVVNPDSSS